MPISWSLITAIVAAIASALYGFYQISLLSSLCPSLSASDCPSNSDFTHSKPHHASWSSWWHPQQNDGDVAEHAQGAGAITKDWNILYHLGGNGPWVEKIIDVVDEGIVPPEGCEVVQVHMVRFVVDPPSVLKPVADVLHLKMSRHAERYPTIRAGKSE
jgi:acid phosphatase